jgi:uncharacterized protein YkwD
MRSRDARAGTLSRKRYTDLSMFKKAIDLLQIQLGSVLLAATVLAFSSSGRCAIPPDLSTRLLEMVNAIRQDPKSFVPDLQMRLKSLKGNLLSIHGKQIATVEGRAAIEEAIASLNAAPPAEPLMMAAGLTKAATLHLTDMASHHLSGHKGSDGSSPLQRIELFGSREGSGGEIIAYEATDPREIVLSFVVDDGMPGRTHRKILLSAVLRYAGIATGEAKGVGCICVIDVVEQFAEKAGP